MVNNDNANPTTAPTVKTPTTGPGPDPQGVLATLARLPERAILDEGALAEALHVSPRTIRRMVVRFELPPPVRLAGRSAWFAGGVLGYIEGKAERAAKESEKAAAEIRRNSP